MQRRIKIFIIFWGLLVAVAACNTLFPTPISDILQNPRKYEGVQVKVSGQVVDIFSLFVVRYFVIKDDTGEITVVTQRPLPTRGEHISVIGKVEEAFSLGDQQLIVIEENPKNN